MATLLVALVPVASANQLALQNSLQQVIKAATDSRLYPEPRQGQKEFQQQLRDYQSRYLRYKQSSIPSPAQLGLPLSVAPQKRDQSRSIGAQVYTQLSNREYVSLNNLLEQLNKDSLVDPSLDIQPYRFFRDISNDFSSQDFQNWIISSPDRVHPYIASAYYHYGLAWQARGTRSIQDTPTSAIQKMQTQLQLAAEAVKKAYTINQAVPDIYWLRIRIFTMSPQLGDPEQARQMGRLLFPRSPVLMKASLWADKPRWGGSFIQMLDTLEASKPNWPKAPWLAGFYGDIWYELGFIAQQEKHYQAAEHFYQRALEYREDPEYLLTYARMQRRLNNIPASLSLLDRALSVDETLADVWLLKAKVLMTSQQLDQALMTTETIRQILPADRNIALWTLQLENYLFYLAISQAQSQPEQAIEHLQQALRLHPQDLRAKAWLIGISQRHGDTNGALQQLQQLHAQDPDSIDVIRITDYLLAEQGRFDEILPFWDRYITRHPNSADAYQERSGTHFHLRNPGAAKADLTRACDLGLRESCMQLQRLRDQGIRGSDSHRSTKGPLNAAIQDIDS
ncbi:tetratricopeptide repeat protein [Oceanobacter mangrovi]|uniref:tetratricopeptide repeat protein n=1 Tax=Oceanobacter mangrovi TaxID=2862510 RepID=UPI001C8DAAF2|nr:tetratricopeptide repeat protein [Oceanobacter mangrovi]